MKKRISMLCFMLAFVAAFCGFSTKAYAATASEVRENGGKASKISFSKKYSGEIVLEDGSCKSNWYKFVTTDYIATYCFNMKNIDIDNPYGLRFVVYDADGAQVDDLGVWCAEEKKGWTKLEKNSVYYVEVKSASLIRTGSYSFSIVPETDDSDDFSGASKLTFGKTYNKSIRVKNGSDFLKFKTPKESAVYSLYFKNIDIENYLTGLRYKIYDSDKQEVYSGGTGSEQTDVYKLKPNSTYYIQFYTTRGIGEYKVKLSCKKENADTKKNADLIKVNTSYTKKIDLKDDVDWFKFKVDKSGYYKFYLKDISIAGRNYDDLYMYIQTSSGKKLYDLSTYLGVYNTVDLKLAKGTYYICIDTPYEFDGKYQFKVSRYANVGKTSISKLTATKKGFKVTWKKQTTGTSGYQIMYSTSKSFKNAKMVSVSKNTSVSKTIKNLTGNKKYYVRVRTYKTYKLKGEKKNVYSAWSSTKTVTTKK